MSISLDFASLRAAYATGTATPVAVAREILSRIAAREDDGVWISRVPEAALLEQAAALEARAAQSGAQRIPLYGLPFAVKDNIDVAGMPTTAACPEFRHLPQSSAPAVDRLIEAGALLVGKTNLDQFATGLVGTRSPYGIPRNPFDPDYIPGGSSSGSAVAVAAGLVSFALGTDTAGSGRVPAAFNNIVGLKPTRGLVSTRGVIPACASLDCVSIFALTVPDATAVLDCIAAFDPENAWSRRAPAGFGVFGAVPPHFDFGVPRSDQREFFGDSEAPLLFDAAIRRLESLGGRPVEIDFAPFREVASMLYGGPWLAERAAAIEAAAGGGRGALHPVTREVLNGAEKITAADVFRTQERLTGLRREIDEIWRGIDVLLLPTTPRIYRIDEVAADPLRLNASLGTYTNFTNLLDLSAIAIPNGFQQNGLPVGITLLAPAFHDPLLAALGAKFHEMTGLPLGATQAALPAQSDASATLYPYTGIAVVGAHLSGQPLNGELVRLGGRFRRAARTAPLYRFYALPDGKRPGLVRQRESGERIEVEIWDVPIENVGAFLATIKPPLGLGTLVLDDGTESLGFQCETYAAEGAIDITSYGGWRAYSGRHTFTRSPPILHKASGDVP